MALKKTTGRMPLTQSQLQTIITDFEEVVNSRPLVYVADDLENQIINQMHFLSLNTENGTPTLSNKIKKIQTTKMKKLRQHKKYLKQEKGHKHLEHFWKSWRENCLSNLSEHNQIFNKHPCISVHQRPSIGDVVQIKDSTPRVIQKIGQRIEVMKSRDVKSCSYLMPNKNILQRSIEHHYSVKRQYE